MSRPLLKLPAPLSRSSDFYNIRTRFSNFEAHSPCLLAGADFSFKSTPQNRSFPVPCFFPFFQSFSKLRGCRIFPIERCGGRIPPTVEVWRYPVSSAEAPRKITCIRKADCKSNFGHRQVSGDQQMLGGRQPHSTQK